MKKFVSLAIALMLCMQGVALASVLSDGWQDASMEELVAAQQEIANQISQLRAAEQPTGEAIELSGSGTQIFADVVVSQIPARVTVTGKVEVTLTGGDYDYTFNRWEYEFACETLQEAGTFEVLVQGSDDWTLTIEPLKQGGTMELSGTGPYVSDLFALDSSTIVHCKMDASELDAWSASLYLKLGQQYENIESWREETVLGDSLFSAPLTLEEDGIIKPVKGRDSYYWVIDVPVGAEWSISAK